MLNHETDVIGNSQNAEKKKRKEKLLSSVIVQNSFHLCGIAIIWRLSSWRQKTA